MYELGHALVFRMQGIIWKSLNNIDGGRHFENWRIVCIAVSWNGLIYWMKIGLTNQHSKFGQQTFP